MNIDLNNFRTSTSKVFSGRDRGKAVREELKLDDIDYQDITVHVIIPNDIYSINTSFFLGAFGKSVRNLGKEKFLTHYTFHCSEVILEDIEEGIERALKYKSVV